MTIQINSAFHLLLLGGFHFPGKKRENQWENEAFAITCSWLWQGKNLSLFSFSFFSVEKKKIPCCEKLKSNSCVHHYIHCCPICWVKLIMVFFLLLLFFFFGKNEFYYTLMKKNSKENSFAKSKFNIFNLKYLKFYKLLL